MLNLKPRFGPKGFGGPKRVKLETQIRAKGFWISLKRVLFLKPRFGPKGFGEPKHVKRHGQEGGSGMVRLGSGLWGGGGGVVRYGVWGVGREGCGVVGGFGTVRYGLV